MQKIFEETISIKWFATWFIGHDCIGNDRTVNFLYHQLSVYYLYTWKNLIVNFPFCTYCINKSTTRYSDYDHSLDLRNPTCKGTFWNPNESFCLISIILSDSVAIQETIHDFEQVSKWYDYLRVYHIFVNFILNWVSAYHTCFIISGRPGF